MKPFFTLGLEVKNQSSVEDGLKVISLYFHFLKKKKKKKKKINNFFFKKKKKK